MPKRPTDTTLPSREGLSVPASGVPPAWALTIVHSPVRALVSHRF